MKISTNSIGNYSPAVKQAANNKEKFNLLVKQDIPAKSAPLADTAITQEEKNYFIDLYPGSKNEITDYHFYRKTGKMSGVQIGSQIDRRG